MMIVKMIKKMNYLVLHGRMICELCIRISKFNNFRFCQNKHSKFCRLLSFANNKLENYIYLINIIIFSIFKQVP